MDIVDSTQLEEIPSAWPPTTALESGLPGRIAARLRAAIIDGSIPPGQRINEEELATAFGTSRTPVREAIRTLESEGLVVIAPRRGATVSVIAPDRAADIFLCRAYLFGLAAKLAAERRSQAEITELRRQIANLREAISVRDRHAYLASMGKFNDQLVEASRSESVKHGLRPLNAQALRYRHLSIMLPNRMQSSLRNYRRIAVAVESRDGVSAEQAARRAIAEAADALLAHFGQADTGPSLAIERFIA